MQIQDIQTLARFLTNTDATSFTDANLLILENQSYERVVGKLIKETTGGKWQFGDDNYTAFPDYVGDLVNSQAEYDLDTLFTDTPLTVIGVEILDQDGIYQLIKPITLERIHSFGVAQSEYQKADQRPLEYEKRENQLVLYPAPDNGVSVTLTGGIKVFYLRTADVFTSAQVSTGTKVPGFPSPWHDILAYETAYHYAVTNGLPNANVLFQEFNRKEQEMHDFISRRNQDDRKIIRIKPITHR